MDVTATSRDVSYNVYMLSRLGLALHCIVIFVSQFSNYDLRPEISDNRLPSYLHAGTTDYFYNCLEIKTLPGFA